MERIALANHAFEGGNNAYLLDGDAGPVLIDSGDRRAATRTQLQEGLADHGVTFADLDRVFITHWHGDHAGLAGEIQAAGGATVYVHRADAPLVAADTDAWADLFTRQDAAFTAWGMPPEKRAAYKARRMGPDALEPAAVVTTFTDGDTFSVGGRTLRAVHAPGHAQGLSLFAYATPSGQEAFVGDALLPVYTPNVGGADLRVDRPLSRYLDSLEAITTADYRRAWPGHRDPIEDPTARAKAIIHHHEERAWKVLDILRRRGPLDTWTVSAELFGELEGIHILQGPGEAHAHLDHLARAGPVIRDTDGAGEATQYRLTAEGRSRLDGMASDRWSLAT